ncbi:hypothetical protein F5Y14DRAFT_462017 [Nemania sp. NC0429]|nr:hypothetical protein F5Y14DRAFT_462017 [Nemania sp. NC0429]
MEFTNPFTHSQQEQVSALEPQGAATDVNLEADTTMRRKPSLRTNFSYPRLSRHESSESRSSNGSVPGMTDASDSDASFDDDGGYDTSACQLWDSFWPDNTTSCIGRQSQQDPQPLQARHPEEEHSELDIKRCHPTGLEGETTRSAIGELGSEVEELTTPRQTSLSPPIIQPEQRKSAATYSVYPKLPVISVERHPHPPRTSSLSFTPPSPPRRPLYPRGNRGSAGLKSAKSSQNIRSLFIPPIITSQGGVASPQEISPLTLTASAALSVPVSPAYPPPPPPSTIRPSTSAFSLRDKARVQNSGNSTVISTSISTNNVGGLVAYNVTPPLPPLLPSPLPEPRSESPGPERFVSVFDFDSDSESEEEEESFARRIARGLHRKSASEKRSASWRKTSAPKHRASDADVAKYSGDKQRNSGSLSSRRGGSLGRIFGLMGR